MADDSCNQIHLQDEHDLQQCESSTAKSNKGDDNDTSKSAAVKDDVDIEETGSLADGTDRRHILDKTELGKTSHKDPQQPIELKCLRSHTLQNVAAIARVAAYTALTASNCCRILTDFTFKDIKIGKKKVDEDLQRAEEVYEFHVATHYRALANKYDAAIKMASKKVRQIEAVVESTKNAAKRAELAANQMDDIPDAADISLSKKISNVYQAANAANMAAIRAYKIEYVAVKAMKKCWIDLNSEHTEITRRRDKSFIKKLRERGIELGAGMTCFIEIVTFIFTLVWLCSCMVAFPVFHLCTVFARYRNKPIEDTAAKESRSITARIDERLRTLQEHFKKFKISIVHLESDDEEQ